MKAKIENLDAERPDVAVLQHAADLLKKGSVIVCPTDTGYAFAANALSVRAIGGVFNLKGRSFSNPIHVAVRDIGEAEKYAFVTEPARFLAGRYLPGALTLVMKKKDIVPSMLVAGMETIGIRIPDNRIMLELLKLVDFPLTTTSANVSGQPGTYAVAEIIGQIGDKIDSIPLLLDQGAIKSREVSTIVDVSSMPPQLIRQGKLSWLDIREELKRFETKDESVE